VVDGDRGGGDSRVGAAGAPVGERFVVFRGAGRAGLLSASWPFARFEVGPETIRVSMLFSCEVGRRDRGDRVEILRSRYRPDFFRIAFADGTTGSLRFNGGGQRLLNTAWSLGWRFVDS
jgi:hypothetical protein